MTERVKVTIADGVAEVRLNRPDKINALDPAMFAAIVEAGEALKEDASVRAVVLSGEGRGFCAGLDFSSFQAMAGDGGGRADDATGSPSPPSATPGGASPTSDSRRRGCGPRCRSP
jgi:enoyl-CoA hydratase/carnithine racemase